MLATNLTAFQALQDAQAQFYGDFRFAEVFVDVKRAPVSLMSRIRTIAGVRDVESRIVRALTLDVPGLDEPAMGRVISLPAGGQPVLNRVYIRSGRLPEAGKHDETLISESFAEANGLKVGETIGAAVNGKWRRLLIVGIGLSPEYIYQIKPGDLFPDSRRFGVMWMNEEGLAAAFDMDGAFNSLTVTLARGASERAVIRSLDQLLKPYGTLGAYGRKNQVSHTFVTDEIRQNRVFGLIMPAIFLGLAGFLVGTILMRLVQIQRDQIGSLKAFGFANTVIASHYLKLAIVIVTVGWTAGIILGGWLAGAVGELYRQFYHFPSLELSLRANTIFATYGVVAAMAAAGCLGAARRALTLAPAEAMRPEAPVSFRSGLLEYLGAARWIPLSGRMILRNIGRYPFKAALSALGIAMGTAILLVGYYFQDALQHLANLQFRQVQREHQTVMFSGPQTLPAVIELMKLPGVLGVEPVRMIPVRISNSYRERRIALIGLNPESRLRRIVSQEGREHSLPPAGLLLTTKLADVLGVGRGDTVSVEALEGKRPEVVLPVTGLVDEALGISAYIEMREANRLMTEGAVSTGAFLLVDPLQQKQLNIELKARPGIAGVSSRTASLASFEETLARTSGWFAYIFVLFASVIVFAAVYNAGRIALSERSRELASLCVLGFARSEVAVVVVGEQAALAAAAIPAGLGIGYLISAWISWAYTLEMFRIPLMLSTRSYLITVLTVGASAALSALVVQRKIVRLNLVAAIKTRE
jgi:putative ABC transport system permease protein